MPDDILGDFDFGAPSLTFDYATTAGWREFVDYSAPRPVPIAPDEYDRSKGYRSPAIGTIASNGRAAHGA